MTFFALIGMAYCAVLAFRFAKWAYRLATISDRELNGYSGRFSPLVED